MLLEQVGECFVGQFLKGRHPVAPQLLQLVECVVIEGDQLAHDRACSCVATDADSMARQRNRSGGEPAGRVVVKS